MTTIEPLAAADFEAVARWLSSPAINRWLTADWREKNVSATVIAIAVRNRRNRFFLVRHVGVPCGLVALSDLETSDHTGMVWYALGEPRFAGKGVITTAVQQLVALAFAELQLHSVYAWAMEKNVASLKVLRKAGFREAGRIRSSATLDGTQTDRIYFDLTRLDLAAGVGAAKAMREQGGPNRENAPAVATAAL